MSSSFDIIPLSAELPTFAAVKALSDRRLREFLRAFDIQAEFKTSFEFLESGVPAEQAKRRSPSDTDLVGIEDDSEYVRVFLEGLDGSTFLSFKTLKDDTRLDDPWWQSRLLLEDGGNDLPELDEIKATAQRINRLWEISRYGGSPPIIHILYGIVAGSLAELTNGIVTSSTWDMSRFPATSTDFFKWHLDQHSGRGTYEAKYVEAVRELQS
ncbi:MAG: hypothetical protein AAFW60_06420 [Pseudomonadota bacterium]